MGTIVQDRILAGAETAGEIVVGIVGVIVAAVAVGDAVVDARAADALRVAQAGAIYLPRNMHRRKVASPADMTIAAPSRAVTRIGARKHRAVRRLR